MVCSFSLCLSLSLSLCDLEIDHSKPSVKHDPSMCIYVLCPRMSVCVTLWAISSFVDADLCARPCPVHRLSL